jgi:hypothetical protein
LGTDDAPLFCRKCMILAERPNYISIYKDGRRPKISNRKRAKKGSDKKIKGSDRIKKVVKAASRKRRSVPKKKIETWSLIVPVRPRTDGDSGPRLYKVLYRHPETGDWFYDVCTQDLIGSKPGYVVEDVLDYIGT